MTKFDKEYSKEIALFNILQRNLDFEAEIKISEPSIQFKKKKKDIRERLVGKPRWKQNVKIALIRTYNFNYANEVQEIKHTFFAVYLRETLNGRVLKSLSKEGIPMDKEIRKLYKLLEEAQKIN